MRADQPINVGLHLLLHVDTQWIQSGDCAIKNPFEVLKVIFPIHHRLMADHCLIRHGSVSFVVLLLLVWKLALSLKRQKESSNSRHAQKLMQCCMWKWLAWSIFILTMHKMYLDVIFSKLLIYGKHIPPLFMEINYKYGKFAPIFLKSNLTGK